MAIAPNDPRHIDLTASDILSPQTWPRRGMRPTVGLDVICTKIAVDFQGMTAETAADCLATNLELLREATRADTAFHIHLDAEVDGFADVQVARGLLATGNPEFPVRVVAMGTKAVHTDKNTPGTYERDVPENVQLLAEFPSGLSLMVVCSTLNEQGIQDEIRGQKGTLYVAGNRVELKPERPFADDVDPEDFNGLKPVEDVGFHEKNWFDCIRANKQPNAGIDLAIRVQTVISLAEMSDRLKVACLFDEKTRKITADGKEIQPITYGTLELS